MRSKPRKRATSSIRSASMRMSKRCGGRRTRQPCGLRLDLVRDGRAARPAPRRPARRRRAIGADGCGAGSPTGRVVGRPGAPRSPAPGPASPPAISSSKAVARSSATAGRRGIHPALEALSGVGEQAQTASPAGDRCPARSARTRAARRWSIADGGAAPAHDARETDGAAASAMTMNSGSSSYSLSSSRVIRSPGAPRAPRCRRRAARDRRHASAARARSSRSW